MNHEYATAAIRADALMRTSNDLGPARFGAIRTFANSTPFRTELIRRLLLQPRWSAAYFAVPANASEAEVAGAYLTLSDLAHAGTEVTAREARSTIQALINRKAYGAAVTLDRLVSRRGSTGSENEFLISINPRITMSLMSHHLIGISAMPPGRLSRWNNPAAGGYWCWGPMGDADTNSFANTLRSRRARTRSATRCRASGVPAAVAISVYCAGSTVPFASSSSDPLQGSDFARRDLHFTVTAACPLVLLAFEAKRTESPVEAQFTELSLNSGATDVPVDSDETGDEDTN